MAKIPEKMRWIYDLLLTAAILAMATVLCTLLRRIDDGSGYVTARGKGPTRAVAT